MLSVFKKTSIVAVFLLLIIATFFSGFKTTSAQGVNDFVITNFNAVYNLDNSDTKHHGHMTIIEDISVDFSGNNHGILRAIPEKYDGNNLNPKVVSVVAPALLGSFG